MQHQREAHRTAARGALEPEPVWASARLDLRRPTPAELPALVSILSDPRVAEGYLPSGSGRLDLTERVVAHFDRAHGPSRLRLCAIRREDRRVVGGAHLDGSELGYFVAGPCWGQGYGGELARAMCHIAREVQDPDSVTAWVRRENLSSRRILEGLGFRFQGLASEARASAAPAALLRYVLRLR